MAPENNIIERKMTEKSRRPLAVRKFKLTKYVAIWLSQKNVTPNQISIASIIFAFVGFCCLATYYLYPLAPLLLLAAISIQLRLLCNLFDGMVAVEGGKKHPRESCSTMSQTALPTHCLLSVRVLHLSLYLV